MKKILNTNKTTGIKKSLIALTSLLVLPNLAFSAGIPVVDTTANQQMATQNAKQVAEWAKELKNALS